EQVAPVEGSCTGPAPESVVDRPQIVPVFAIQDQRKHSVVGGDENVPSYPPREREPGGTHARVDHHDMHSPPGKITVAGRQQESGGFDVVRWHLMGDVNDRYPGIVVENDPLHRPDEVVAGPEVGEQCDDHVSTPSPPPPARCGSTAS